MHSEKHTALAKEANAKSLENRQDIQEQAQGGKRVVSLEVKRLERQRLLDHQRSEIHPSHAQDTLQALVQYQQQAVLPPVTPKSTGILLRAVPEDNVAETPIVYLTVRKLEDEHD